MLELIYWPSIQGRGEFARLLLEELDADYVDVARVQTDGFSAVQQRLYGHGATPGFAPPFLVDGELEIAQMALVCAYLGETCGFAPTDEPGKWRARQLMMTVADVVNEAHDVHHPVSTALYFEDQRDAAIRAASSFCSERIGKWLGFFERCLASETFLCGPAPTYPDVALFQLIEGLRFAFPETMTAAETAAPRVVDVRDAIAARPRIRRYLESERRLPFNQDGIFRHYPELDILAATD